MVNSRKFSNEVGASIGDIFCYFFMVDQIKKVNCKTDLIKKTKSTFMDRLNIRFKGLESHTLISVAALLDPRYKRKIFPEDGIAFSKARRNVVNMIQQRTSSSRHQENVSSNVPKAIEVESSSSYCSDELRNYYHEQIISKANNWSTSTLDLEEVELKKFLDTPPQQNVNPIQFWNEKKQTAPILSSIALEHLTIPATSVPCERLFSSAGHIASAIRNRLSAAHLKQIVFLKSLDASEWHL